MFIAHIEHESRTISIVEKHKTAMSASDSDEIKAILKDSMKSIHEKMQATNDSLTEIKSDITTLRTAVDDLAVHSKKTKQI